MSTHINRREAIRGAIAFTVGAPTIMGAAMAYDPLLSVINAYKTSCEEFTASQLRPQAASGTPSWIAHGVHISTP